MDITVQREVLLKPLQAVSSVIERRHAMPILANVLVKVENNRLSLTRTDLEVELVGFVALENVDQTAAITVSARKLFDICRTLPDASHIRLTLEKNNLLVSAGESVFKLNTLPVADFPYLEEADYSANFTLPLMQLKNLFSKTSFAMAQQDVRHYLNGAFLDITPNTIKCVAADGHRLAMTSITDNQIGDVQARMIVPRKSVLELIRLLNGEPEEIVQLAISDNRFQVTTSDFIFTTKLINAQYPDYSRLIPHTTSEAIGDRKALHDALTRASILSNEKFRGVRFQLEGQKLLITANNADEEHASETLNLDYTGQEMEFGFNVAYLLDAISTIATKKIRCAFKSPHEGVLIAGVDDPSLYVVMPMRL